MKFLTKLFDFDLLFIFDLSLSVSSRNYCDQEMMRWNTAHCWSQTTLGQSYQVICFEGQSQSRLKNIFMWKMLEFDVILFKFT